MAVAYFLRLGRLSFFLSLQIICGHRSAWRLDQRQTVSRVSVFSLSLITVCVVPRPVLLLLTKTHKSPVGRAISSLCRHHQSQGLVVCVYRSSTCTSPSSPCSGWSDVHNVKLSRSNCMINVESLYDSSLSVSNSAMASSNACFARWHARSGELRIS
jgi:hypothetical protein